MPDIVVTKQRDIFGDIFISILCRLKPRVMFVMSDKVSTFLRKYGSPTRAKEYVSTTSSTIVWNDLVDGDFFSFWVGQVVVIPVGDHWVVMLSESRAT